MADSSSSSSGLSSDSSSASVVSGARRLTVTVSTQASFRTGRDTGIRTVIAVATADNMPSDVFRYMAQPVTDSNPAAVAYDGVCSPADLEEFPVGDPDPAQFPPFCRRNVVDLVFRSSTQADEMRSAILYELQALVDTLNRMDTLGEPATHVIE